MFVAILSWTGTSLAGSVEAIPDAGVEPTVAGVMTIGIALVFAGWIAYGCVRQVVRMRRAEGRAAVRDFHAVSLQGLGTTMADGGEPVAPAGGDRREASPKGRS